MATVTVNGKKFTEIDLRKRGISARRLSWRDIAALAKKPNTDRLKVSYTVPGDPRPKPFNFGFSLIIVDGMSLSVV